MAGVRSPWWTPRAASRWLRRITARGLVARGLTALSLATPIVSGCGDAAPPAPVEPSPPLDAGTDPPAAPLPDLPALFDAPGVQALRPRPRLGWPVQSVHITSSFGWRIDPVSGRGTRLHRGLDLRGAIGDLVLSIGDGRVDFVGHDPLLGTMVVIDHGDGLTSLYGHLSDVLVVTEAPVERGAAIGLVGNTGRSAAPHLHLTVKLDGIAIDPLEVIGEPPVRPLALVAPYDADPSAAPVSPVDPAPGPAPAPAPTPGPAEPPEPPVPGSSEAPETIEAPVEPRLLRRPLPHRSDDGGHG